MASLSSKNPKNVFQPPVCPKKPVELTLHGHTRLDPYFWLKERDNPEVIAYLEAENAYREKEMAHLKSFENALFEEMVSRIKQTDMSVPYKMNGYWYYTRHEEGKEYPFYCRKKESLDAPEEIMLDVNELAQPYSYYQIGGLSVSPDNQMLAYGEDTVSRRIYTIRFKNLQTGETLSQKIENASPNAVWANDNNTIFFTRKDETLRPFKVFKRKMLAPEKEDELVWHEKDSTFSTFCYKSKSRKYIFIGSYQTVSSEFKYLEADNPDGPLQMVEPRTRDLEYAVEHFGEHFFISTNYQAKNFRLVKAPVETPGLHNWKEVIPHREDILLEDVDIFKNFLVLSERVNGIRKIRVRDWAGNSDFYIDFGEDAYVAHTTANLDFDTELLRLSYTSLTTPNSVLDFHMKNRTLKILKEQEVLGGFDKYHYSSERHFAVARDGTTVPISLVYRKGSFQHDGKAPLLLYGYGSYGASMDPYFSSSRLSLLDRGFVFAIAHIRGGEEMGRSWYEAGKLLNKKNTFFDFIDCAKFLLDKKFTSSENLFAMGGSAGGLLMGAIINLEPSLWKGIVAAVPFVDVVTTMLDESIPLTTGEFDEWGNPHDQTYYDYMFSYSPYDNVERKGYPAMLVTTGLHDSQVQYWEPAKWVAKLRDLKTDNHPLYLFCNMETGHSGASGRFAQFREIAMEYAFLLDLAGRAGNKS